MQNAFIDSFQDVSAPGYRTLQELNEIASRAVRKLAEIQYKIAAIGIDGTVGQAKLLTNASGYAEWVQAQQKLASECGSRLVAVSREAAEVLAESRDEWVAWMEKGMSVATLPGKAKTQVKAKGTARRAATGKAA